MENTQNFKNTENTQNVKTESFPIEIQIGLKTLKVRKWKAKDRKNFKKLSQKEKDISDVIKKTLVYSCLENKYIPLTEQEIEYLFIQLRKISISDEFDFTYTCDNCEFKNTITLKIDDVSKPVFNSYTPIKSKNYEIVLQDIQNKDFYEKNKDEFDDVKEIAFRIYSINGDNTKGFNEIIEIFNEMEINEFDYIYEEFQKMNFNIDNTHAVKCSNCNEYTFFEFDEIQNFFPESWTK